MGDLTLNPNLVARSYDTNRNNLVSDDLKISNDKKTLKALGGDANVTVEELAKALDEDKVIIKNGTVESPNIDTTIPLFHDNDLVGDAISRALKATKESTESIPGAPSKLFHSDPADYQKAMDEHKAKLVDKKYALNSDNKNLLNTLKEISEVAKDFEIKQVAARFAKPEISSAMGDEEIKNKKFDSPLEEEVNKLKAENKVLREKLKDIEKIMDINQPESTLRKADKEIRSAFETITEEQTAIDTRLSTNIKRAEVKIEDIKNGIMPFKESRMNTVKEDIEQAKKFTTDKSMKAVENLAQKAYEVSIEALNGDNSLKHARNLNEKAEYIKTQAETIDKEANSARKKVENLGGI